MRIECCGKFAGRHGRSSSRSFSGRFPKYPPRKGLSLFLLIAIVSISASKASLPSLPDLQVWVSMRGSSVKYVLTHLEAAATHKGMTCRPYEIGEQPSLLCQFPDEAYNAIITKTYAKYVQVQFFYSENDSAEIVSQRESMINALLDQFDRDVKGSWRIKAVVRCSAPIHFQTPDSVCDGKNLLEVSP
jgi:hypothetical protein